MPASLHRPSCLVFYAGDPCEISIQQYNDLVAERKQQEWATSALTPLRAQIAEQQKIIAGQQQQIKTLQVKIDSQTIAALQRDARERASVDFLGAIIGVGLAFLVALAAFRKLARAASIHEYEPEQARSASAS